MANRFQKYLEPVETEQAPSNRFSKYAQSPSVSTESDDSRGITDVVGDLWSSYAGGANALLKIGGDIYGLTTGDMDNWASDQGRRGQEYWNSRKSDQLIKLEDNRKSKVDAAETDLGKAGAAFWETISSPSLLSSFLFEQAPMLLPVGGVGRGAGAVAKTMGATEKVVGRVATGAAVSAGGAMQGSDAGSQAYDQLKAIPDDIWMLNDDVADRVSAGDSLEDIKEEKSIGLSRNAAVSSMIASIGLNMIPGARQLERALAGAKLPKGKVSGIVSGFAGESLQEGLEEGSGALFANLVSQDVDPSIEAMAGVGEATGLGLTSGVFGGVAGATGAKVEAEQINRIFEADTVEDSIDVAVEAVDSVEFDVSPVVSENLSLSPEGEPLSPVEDIESIDFVQDALDASIETSEEAELRVHGDPSAVEFKEGEDVRQFQPESPELAIAEYESSQDGIDFRVDPRDGAKAVEQEISDYESRDAISDQDKVSEKEDLPSQSTIQIDQAANEAATSPENNLPEPTDAQKEAGNYKMSHVKVQGLDVSIENPKGSIRSGTDTNNKSWSIELQNHYGYIKRTKGADGDHVDVFIGDNPESETIFVVDQVNVDGTFDEHKVLVGFDSQKDAVAGYKSNYEEGWEVGPVTEMSVDEFKEWIDTGDNTQPINVDFRDVSVEQGQVKSTELQKVSRGGDEKASVRESDDTGTEDEGQVPISSGSVSAKGDDTEGRLQELPEPRIRDASPGLPTTVSGDLAVQEVSPDGSQREAGDVERETSDASALQDGAQKEPIAKVLPPILAQTKSRYLKKMLKSSGVRSGSPGYATAVARTEEQYEEEYDQALATVSFEQYNELNQDIPESLNRQAYDQLVTEYGEPTETEKTTLPPTGTEDVAESPNDELVGAVKELTVAVKEQIALQKAPVVEPEPETIAPTTEGDKPLFSQESPAKQMSALHNLSSENLLFADEMGGLAVPSIGVVNEDMGIEGYGEITLIGKSHLGDPSVEDVYDADAYTATFPKAEYSKAKVKDAQNLVDEIRPWVEKYHTGLGYALDPTWENAVNYPNPSEIISSWIRDNGIMAMYLEETTGVTPRTMIKDEPLSDSNSAHPLIVEFFNNIPSEMWHKGSSDPELVQLYKDIKPLYKKALEDKYAGRIDSDLAETLMDSSFNEDGSMHFSKFETIRNDQRKIGNKVVDEYALRERFEKKLKGKEADFQKWVTDKVMSIFGEPYLKIGRKKANYTLENIVDYMSSKDNQNSQDTMTFGPGNARATAAKQFTDVNWMRNEAAYSLKQKSDLADEREKADKLLEDYRMGVIDYYTEKNWSGEVDIWGGLDSSMKAIAYWAKNHQKRGGKSALRAGLRNNNFSGVPDHLIDKGIEAGEAMLYAPVPYFEAKPKRAVGLNEFSGAVVPNDISKEVLAVLEKNNIQVKKYGSRYDEPARTKAVVSLRNKLSRSGENVLFSDLSAQENQSGSNVKTVTDAIAGVVDSLNADPVVNVVGNISELPESIRQEAAEGSRPKGVYYDGQVYLIADNIRNARDARVVLAHELVGHKGVLEMSSPEEWADIKTTIANLTEFKNTTALNIMEEVDSRYPGLDEETRFKEFLAIAAERRVKRGSVGELVAKVKEMLRRFLKNMGFTQPFSESELDIILSNSERYLRESRGQAQGSLEPAFSNDERSEYDQAVAKGLDMSQEARMQRARDMGFDTDTVYYHGTDQEFDSFDINEFGKTYKTFGEPSIYTTNNMDHSKNFGNKIKRLYLKKTNFREISGENLLNDVYNNFESYQNEPFIEWRDSLSINEIYEVLDLDNYLGSEAIYSKIDGYKGIIFKVGEDEIILSFDESDIRSVDAAFDPEYADSGNLLFSREAPASEFSAPEDTLTSVAVRKIQDKFKVLKDLQANIKESGGAIDEKSDAYLAEELFHGKAENDIRLFNEQFVEPLANKMSEFGINHSQLDEYLYAKHAKERNAHIAEINPDMPDGGSGMTNREADSVLSAVRQTGKQGEYDQLTAIVYDMLQEKRDLIRNGGLEDDGLIEAWEDKYENYVPLKGWADDTKEQGIPGAGKGFSVSGKESRQALGRSTKSASPLSYAIGDVTKTLIRKRKNEVGNAFLKLAQDNPNKDYWEVFTDENPDTDRRLVNGIVREMPIPMAMVQDRYFSTKKDGKTYYIKLNDDRLMTAMKNLGPQTNNALIRTLGSINRVLSALNTSYSPEFIVSNFARDIQTAVLNLQAEQSLEEGKVTGEKIALKTVKNTPTAMRAIYASLSGNKLKGRGAQWQKYFDEFREDGAKTGWFDMKDLDGQAKELQDLVTMAEGGFKGSALKFMKQSSTLIENLNQSVENAVRLSAYANARQAGISRTHAASLSKNMTVNFNRKGEMGATMNALYMFANASVQGVANFARTMVTLKGNKSLKFKNLNNAQRIAIGITAGAYFFGMINRMSAGDDDDGENWYDKVPSYVKERNLVIMKSVFGGEQNGEYWRIPLPYGYNIFYVLGGGMESVFNGNKSTLEASTNLALAGLGSFSPIGFQESETIAGLLLKNAAPTVMKPVVEIGLNENFMGSSIYNENFPFGTQKPESSLGRRSTPEAYKNLSEWMNESTGGSEYRSGAIDINPDIMQYLTGYFGGSAYSFFGDKLPDYAYRKSTGVEVQPHRVPFLSRITGKVMPYEDVDLFYKRRDEINQIEDEFKALRGVERREFRREFNDQLKMRGSVKLAERMLRRMRRRRDNIYNRDLSPFEKDRQLKEIELDMKGIIDRFNKAYTSA